MLPGDRYQMRQYEGLDPRLLRYTAGILDRVWSAIM